MVIDREVVLASRIAPEVVPVPLSELTVRLSLIYVPTDETVTFTATVQVPPAAIVPPPVKEMLVFPDTGVVYVGVPQPLIEKPVGFATTIPAGKVSLNARLVCALVVEGFAIVIVNVDELPVGIVLGENALLNCGT